MKSVTDILDVVQVKDVDEKFVYVTKSDSYHGLITRQGWGAGLFQPRLLERKFTGGNGWDQFAGSTLQKCIQKCLDNGWKVYQFDTMKEAVEYLANEL